MGSTTLSTPIIHQNFLTGSWVSLILCLVFSFAYVLCNLYYSHYFREREYAEALKKKFETEANEIASANLANVRTEAELAAYRNPRIEAALIKQEHAATNKKKERFYLYLWLWFGRLARLGFVIGLGLLVAFAISNSSAHSEPQTGNSSVVSPPTATEIFTLRSRCAELGQKIMEHNFIGSALTQDVTTHYDPQTNRCYAELDVTEADLTKYNDYNFRAVYDGQTREILASVTNDKGQKTAFVKDGGLKTTDWNEAIMQIGTLMADSRKK